MTDPTPIQHALEVAKAAGDRCGERWKLRDDDPDWQIVVDEPQPVTYSYKEVATSGQDHDDEMNPPVATHIATFDPETVTALLDAVQAAKERQEATRAVDQMSGEAWDTERARWAMENVHAARRELADALGRVEALLSSKGGRG